MEWKIFQNQGSKCEIHCIPENIGSIIGLDVNSSCTAVLIGTSHNSIVEAVWYWCGCCWEPSTANGIGRSSAINVHNPDPVCTSSKEMRAKKNGALYEGEETQRKLYTGIRQWKLRQHSLNIDRFQIRNKVIRQSKEFASSSQHLQNSWMLKEFLQNNFNAIQRRWDCKMWHRKLWEHFKTRTHQRDAIHRWQCKKIALELKGFEDSVNMFLCSCWRRPRLMPFEAATTWRRWRHCHQR